ncbi:MAG: HD domain-containing protein [bacterium]
MIFRAIEFAVRAHAGQYRRGTRVPYIVHPLRVAKLLLDRGCSEEMAVAGVLHDTLEDTPVTSKDLRTHFGEEVARLVEAASEPDKSDTWENRKQHTIETLKTAPLEVLWLVCADKLDNVRSIREEQTRLGDAVWSKFNRPRDKQKWYYESLANLFLNRVDSKTDNSLFMEFKNEVQALFQ